MAFATREQRPVPRGEWVWPIRRPVPTYQAGRVVRRRRVPDDSLHLQQLRALLGSPVVVLSPGSWEAHAEGGVTKPTPTGGGPRGMPGL
jgi:hypothetical protein